MNDFINKIIYGDSLKVIPALPDNFVDLCVTSPPFNVNLQGYDKFHDMKDHKIYIDWLKSIFAILYLKLKKGGRVAINVGDGKNGRIATHAHIMAFMEELGYLTMTTIIWDREKVASRTSWGTFMSPSCPSFPTPYEHIMIFAKEDFKLQEKGETDLTREEFVQWSMALWRPLKMEYLDVRRLIKNKVHPAAFPEEIPKRLIKMLSWKGAIVLDPFCGVGTVPLAAKRLERKFIGIDNSKKYCDYAEKRLKNVTVIESMY